MSARRLIGRGVLSWMGRERVSDRYGAVILMPPGSDSEGEGPGERPALDLLAVGASGALVAEVLETRDSTHVGDLFRGIAPTRPAVGEVVRLGSGRLFSETSRVGGWVAVGLRPDDGRDSDWLDPRALYRVHEQTVSLWFEVDCDGCDPDRVMDYPCPIHGTSHTSFPCPAGERAHAPSCPARLKGTR